MGFYPLKNQRSTKLRLHPLSYQILASPIFYCSVVCDIPWVMISMLIHPVIRYRSLTYHFVCNLFILNVFCHFLLTLYSIYIHVVQHLYLINIHIPVSMHYVQLMSRVYNVEVIFHGSIQDFMCIPYIPFIPGMVLAISHWLAIVLHSIGMNLIWRFTWNTGILYSMYIPYFTECSKLYLPLS